MATPLISTRSRLRMLTAAGIGLAGGVGLSRELFAQDVASPAAEPGGETVITIHAQDFAFDMPAEVPSGWTRVEMINDGAEEHHAQFLLLPDGVTVDDFMATFEAEGEAALATVGPAGGPGSIAPGGTSVAIINLAPGNYAVACFVPSPDGELHIMKGMIAPLTVTTEQSAEQAAAAPPVADETVTMIDFAFTMPEELPAGETTIEVINEGVEPHEFAVLALEEGTTTEMVAEILAASPLVATPNASESHDHGTPAAAQAGPPPFTAAGGLQGVLPGVTAYAVLDLDPGDYTAICFIPSLANDGQRHFMLGMIAGFTVA